MAYSTILSHSQTGVHTQVARIPTRIGPTGSLPVGNRSQRLCVEAVVLLRFDVEKSSDPQSNDVQYSQCIEPPLEHI